ncbi:ribosomal protein L1 [Phanerochaete sordida]|uniref:Ribosomal L1 domain-containing protein 1 n=1 Tax=Phanerochaete sordida TaxID=48140 RepID=A0A9P3G9K1_9APHY|nr:ribosomal protein L1 [Phanerochaete sordida]
MAAAQLIDEHVSEKQCKLAVDALLKHESKRQEKLQESQLLPGKEQHVWLQVTVKQMHAEKKLKPHRIPLAHPLVDPRTSPVCLITKDPQREYKDLLEANNIKFVSRVVGVTKLKGKFKPYEARRMLLKENDLFLADERVVPLLPGLLGKKFFEAKKQPIPVCLTRKDLKGELERAISSTYFHQNQGTCSSIKVGTVSLPAAKVFANLKSALPAVAKAVKGGWDNIQALHIKTSTSTSLPIWTCDLSAEEGGRWSGLVEDVSEDESEAEESAAEAAPVEAKKGAKGKKRAAEDEAEPPKKKAKAASKAAVAPEAPAAKKRKGAQDAAVAPAAPAAAAAAPEPTKKGKGKAPAAAPVPEPSTSSAPAPATPTAAAPRRSGRRASATDFFEDEKPAAAPAPPPNTPADGLKAKKGRKSATGAPTPVSGAIAQLEEEAEPAGKPAKKTRAKGAKAQDAEEAAADAGAEAEAPAKKARKAKVASGDAPAASAAAASVSAAEVKRKVAAASGLEKKKEKALKVKRSAKEALLGKKGL